MMLSLYRNTSPSVRRSPSYSYAPDPPISLADPVSNAAERVSEVTLVVILAKKVVEFA
jgi:hypothetical protein